MHHPRTASKKRVFSSHLVENRVIRNSASDKYWVETDGISEYWRCASRTLLACMLLTQVRNGASRRMDHFYGLVGMIKSGRGAILVTSLHNPVSEADEDGSDRLTAQHALLFSACRTLMSPMFISMLLRRRRGRKTSRQLIFGKAQRGHIVATLRGGALEKSFHQLCCHRSRRHWKL